MTKKLSLWEQFVAAMTLGRAEPPREWKEQPWWEEREITADDVAEAQMRAAVRKALVVSRNYEKGVN